jgi:hypothetical protein
LVTSAHYLTEAGQYDQAKELYNDTTVFTDAERQQAIREIDTIQAYKRR